MLTQAAQHIPVTARQRHHNIFMHGGIWRRLSKGDLRQQRFTSPANQPRWYPLNTMQVIDRGRHRLGQRHHQFVVQNPAARTVKLSCLNLAPIDHGGQNSLLFRRQAVSGFKFTERRLTAGGHPRALLQNPPFATHLLCTLEQLHPDRIEIAHILRCILDLRGR